MPEIGTNEATYKKISAHVDKWLELHKGEMFELDTLCKQLEITERENRNLVTIKLAYEVKRGRLEKGGKGGRIYRYIDNTLSLVQWVNASEADILEIAWPYGREDGTQFGFDGRAIVSPGDIIVIAGVSNMGKTAFCLNFLWENMDKYPCFLMGNEYKPAKFKRRVARMDWADPLREDGIPKFDLVERHDNWKDIIRPDSINIIDWINLGGDFYQIGTILEGIQSKLKNGIALISLQKGDDKDLAVGGQYSEHISSIYLTIDFERITVRKVKEWKEWNPNKTVYGFQLFNGGTKFGNIRQIKKCPKCYGTGHSKNAECDLCLGKGWCDA